MNAMNALKEMRALANVTLQEAAAHVGIAYSTVWQAERGYARLKPEQEATLTRFYYAQVQERLARVVEVLASSK